MIIGLNGNMLMLSNIKGAIFDMDGVLLNSEILYQRFWCEAGREFGYPFEAKHVLRLRSLTGINAIKVLEEMFHEGFPYEEVKARRKILMEEHIDKYGVEVKEGVREILEYLKEQGIKLALATSSERNRAKKHLSLNGLWDYFDETVCGGEVVNGKPEPDIYELAAKKLGFKPEECLAFEDSPNGVTSAYRAGCITVMVPDLDEPTQELMSMVDYKIDGLNKFYKINE